MSRFLTTVDIDRLTAISNANKLNDRCGDRLHEVMKYHDTMTVDALFVQQSVKPECAIAFCEAYNKYKQLKNTLCYCIAGEATDAMHLTLVALETELFNSSADWYK